MRRWHPARFVQHRDTAASILVYGVGLLSMLAIDLVATSTGDAEQISSWALLKSSVAVGAPLALLGLDQALVRSPGLLRRVTPAIALQAIVLSVVAGTLVGIATDLPWWQAGASIFATASASYVYAAFRARSHLTSAQIALQGWKVFALVAGVLLVLRGGWSPPTALVIIVGNGVALVGLWLSRRFRLFSDSGELPDIDRSIRALYSSGFVFAATIVVLNLSLFLEQLLLNSVGTAEDSARLFSHTSVVLPFIVFANGYANFWLGSFARRDGPAYVAWWSRHARKVVVAAACLATAGVLVGFLVAEYMPSFSFRFEWGIAVTLGLIGGLRTLFFIPSAYLAVWANGSELRQFLAFNIVGIVTFVMLFTVGIALTGSAVYSAIAGSCGNWIIRVWNAHHMYARVRRRIAGVAILG